ncbi:MAG: hypothetical protein KDA96_18270, partial [Planctomycetaceae bacterium]|nr:hypothetical protein [Planctomycetaceae bacterium]
CSQFRSLPSLKYAADPALYRYLVQHPDVAVSTWRVMGISRFQMWQTGATEYEAEASDGSIGIADILYRDQNRCLFICEGSYANPLLPKPLEAKALVWFTSAFEADQNGTPQVTQHVDVFVSFPSAGVSTVAKMLAPVTNPMMDRNVFEVSLYAGMMSRAVANEPEWVKEVARQMEGVLPQRRTELTAIADQPRARMERMGTVERKANGGNHAELLSMTPAIFEPPVIRAEDLGTSATPSAQSVGNTKTGLATGNTQQARPGEVPPVPGISPTVAIPNPAAAANPLTAGTSARTVSQSAAAANGRKPATGRGGSVNIIRSPAPLQSVQAAPLIQIVPGFRNPQHPVTAESVKEHSATAAPVIQPAATENLPQVTSETADQFELQDVVPPPPAAPTSP